MEEYYTIQTPDHYNNIFIELLTLQEQGVLCDVVLIAEDGQVMAHKIVLMAVSKYFRDRLSPVLGLNPTKICLKGISANELANLIQYIYTGNLLVAKESMDVILEISEILGLSGVLQGYKDIILYEEGRRQQEMSIQSSVESTMASCHATDVDGNSTVVASSAPQSSTAEQHQDADQAVTKNSVDRNPNVIQADNSDEVIESVNQSIAADYNFVALYDQQYVDVTAGTNSPLKLSPVCGSQTNSYVNSDLGGKNDIYTVSLDPLSVKTILGKPKPRRSKPRKENYAEELARLYKQNSLILQSDLKDKLTEQVSLSSLKTENVANDGPAETSSSVTQNQESPTQTKKNAAFVPRVIFTKTKLKEDDHVNNEKINDVVDTEALANRQLTDDFAQGIKTGSFDADNEVNGMIANDIVGIMNNTSDSESNTQTKGEVPEFLDAGTLEKYLDNSNVSMSPKRHSDDEATEKMRSSALKPKTKIPKIEPYTDGEWSDCSIGKRVNISDFRVSKSLLPEVRLKKLSMEEILQISKDFKEKKTSNYSCVTDRTCDVALKDEKSDDIEAAVPVTTKSAISNGLKRKLADESDTISPSKARNINDQDLSDKDNLCEEASDSSTPTNPSSSKDVKLVAEFIVPACNDGTFKCQDDVCVFSTTNKSRMKHHVYMFHGPGEDVQVVEQSVEEEVPIFAEPKEKEERVWKNVDTDEILCHKCPKTFKTTNLMKKHYIASHSGNEYKCSRCDYVAHVESNLTTHMKLKHSIPENGLGKCPFCSYGNLRDNLKNHIFYAHGLVLVTHHMTKTNQKYFNLNDGDIATIDGKLFDPKTMTVPKNWPKAIPAMTVPSRKNTMLSRKKSMLSAKKNNMAEHTRSLLKLPVNVFVKEVMKRHEKYRKKPEQEITCKCKSIIKASEQPSLPQASPHPKSIHANKVYNTQKLTLPVQEPRVHGYITNLVGIPGVENKVEVMQHGYPEVVMENVESGESNDVLTISEQTDETDGEELIIINQSGKQTVVRSKDFYDTLSATGHDSQQTIEMIANLLQAGEQIEIREQKEEKEEEPCEQEDFVEIQNA